MDNVFKLISLIILSYFSGLAFADTYPSYHTYTFSLTGSTALWYTGGPYTAHNQDEVCSIVQSNAKPHEPPYNFIGVSSTAAQCCNNGVCSGTNGIHYLTLTPSRSCPNGGSLSGDTCVNAPVCLSPQVRQTISPYACVDPVECVYPEIDNGSGVCQNLSCPVGQVRNPSTNQCQVKPTCGTTETYDIYSNTCKLYPLNCPGHSHANTANDQCLPDAPLVCPAGQHDDGTYTCVADDASACKSNQYAGYINGIPQCITKPNLDTAQQAAADAAQAKIDKQNELITAINNNQAAQAALAADPSNPTLQAAAVSAQNAQDDAVAAASKSAAESDKAGEGLQTEILKSIDLTLKDGAAQDAADRAVGFGDVSEADEVTEVEWTGTTGTFTGSGSCPAPEQLQVAGRSISFSYAPYCDFASMIRPIILAAAWLGAALISYGAIKG